ncbi:10782_t:CDS:2 [Dentiscutata heterogama]|uniref:10782_t:CDS:1 n=1 Tax=Dentiscutata heterogama TaxID=1316150 RepID=A0ACA9KCK4_9GLOM|nr:10782_t:CDS:2 [Dentiscutata heterogama]
MKVVLVKLGLQKIFFNHELCTATITLVNNSVRVINLNIPNNKIKLYINYKKKNSETNILNKLQANNYITLPNSNRQRNCETNNSKDIVSPNNNKQDSNDNNSEDLNNNRQDNDDNNSEDLNNNGLQSNKHRILLNKNKFFQNRDTILNFIYITITDDENTRSDNSNKNNAESLLDNPNEESDSIA